MMLKKNQIVHFSSNGNLVTGHIKSETKIDKYNMVIGLDGKRYLLTDEEIFESRKILKEKELQNEKQVHPEGEEVEKAPEKRKRGRPRKLG